MNNIKTVFRALRHQNYRLFFGGQSISLIGTWMQMIAVSWLVYRMTNSPFLLGLVGFSSQIAAFLLAPLAGVIADRHHRHKLLLITQSLAMLQAFVLYLLYVTHSISVWHIIALSLFLGAVSAFDIPVRQSFTIDMINNKEDLSNAIALNSSMVNAARLIGPSIGGILIASFGEGTCFLFNALSYIAVLFSLLMMKLPRWEKPIHHSGSVMTQLKEGFRYAYDFMPIRAILILLAISSMVAGGMQSLMPVFARDIFHGGSKTLGLLMAASGLGALMGAIYLASRHSVIGLGRIIAITAGIFGVGIIIFSKVSVLWVAMPVLLFTGFGMMVQMASSNIILQTIVEEDKRGRVMSFYTMAFMGLSPFGSLFAGLFAVKLGADNTLLVAGAICIISALIFALLLPKIRKFIRPVYVKKGIITEVIG